MGKYDGELAFADTGTLGDDGSQRTRPGDAGFCGPHEARPGAGDDQVVVGRPIGEILRELCKLQPQQIEQVLAHQRAQGLRFGEAAIALGYATTRDVLFALAQQFHYHYAPQALADHPELVMLNHPFSHQAEAFRAIRAQLVMRMNPDGADRMRADSPPDRPRLDGAFKRALAVVSPDTGDGKTFFSANLAVALAQLGERTLLVDCDLRGPRQHEVFGLRNEAGLSALLSGRLDRQGAQVVQQVAAVPSLYVLPVGVTPPNPLELVERPAFGLLMRELLTRFDHVVVDTPAAIYGADSFVIAARCGAALVVARRHASRVGALQELSGVLSESPAKLVGVVLNEF